LCSNTHEEGYQYEEGSRDAIDESSFAAQSIYKNPKQNIKPVRR
jgi:hypothetical protein